MAEVDMKEVTFISVNHDIVGVTIAKTQYVARHTIASSRSDKDISNLFQLLFEELVELIGSFLFTSFGLLHPLVVFFYVS